MFLIALRFNSMLLFPFLVIMPSFSILLNSVDRAGRVTLMYSASWVMVCVSFIVDVPLSILFIRYTSILSRMVFLDSTSSRIVVHTLQFPETQRKFFNISGYLLISSNVESLVAVSNTDLSIV